MFIEDHEGADPILFDEPATPEIFGEASPVDDFAVNHDEVELIDEEWAEEAAAEYVPVDFDLEKTDPTDDDLHELEKETKEAA